MSALNYLQEFKRLEKRLAQASNVSNETVGFHQMLKTAKLNKPIIEYKEDVIRDLYALRNVFAHADRERYIAEVNQQAFDEIESILELLDSPPTVGSLFRKDVHVAYEDSFIEDVITKMRENLYTHVPVYRREEHGVTFVGIFSESTVFSWLAHNLTEGDAGFHKVRMKDVNPRYLNDSNDAREFVSAKKDVFTIFKLFEDAIADGRRLGVVLITESGNKDEHPIGIITAWDLPQIKQYIS